jgi:hypothetical protein
LFKNEFSCQAKYPAGYPVSGSYRISGIRLLDNPDIRLAGYPAKTVSGASLLTSNYLGLIFHRLPVSFFIDYEFDGLWY